MKIVYLDQNVFSRLAEVSDKHRFLLFLKKLVRDRRILIPITDAHIRETAKTTDEAFRAKIWRLQAVLTQGIHFSLSSKDKLSASVKPELFETLPVQTQNVSKETMKIFKTLQKQTPEVLGKTGIDSKTLNHSSIDDLIRRFDNIFKIPPPINTTKAEATIVETALEATAGFIQDLWPGKRGIATANQFRQEAAREMALHQSGVTPKDLRDAGDTIANIYNSTGSTFITPPVGIFLFLSHAGYWTDINKPLEIEDSWHVQYGWFAHHFISADQRLLKRFELTKAIFSTVTPKLHDLSKFMGAVTP